MSKTPQNFDFPAVTPPSLPIFGTFSAKREKIAKVSQKSEKMCQKWAESAKIADMDVSAKFCLFLRFFEFSTIKVLHNFR